ncbi:endonuclease/exonuclease/phosphatase family protein [Actinoplanes sp. NPDC051861]|uniref:endonuclease/exonuclease/phosphatase family protein n=1 Tax=Actinoplanes sp. NPDC051861 TaxID=3155170 RepID=UPI00341444D1
MRRLVAAALVLLVAGCTPGPPEPAPGTETLTVWQWNVAGWVLNGGSATNGMVQAAVTSILSHDADLVAFNEICWDQFVAVRDRLHEVGWPADSGRFGDAWSDHCAGKPFGNALLSRRPLGATDRISLAVEPADEGEVRNLVCSVVAGTRLRFCVTHLSPHGVVATQSEQVRTHVEAYPETVVVAGDLNSQPDVSRLDTWYSSSANTSINPDNSGRFRELGDTGSVCPGYGPATTYRTEDGPCGTGLRIDLIFVPEDRVAGRYSAASEPITTACGGPCSDHRITYGRVTLRP